MYDYTIYIYICELPTFSHIFKYTYVHLYSIHVYKYIYIHIEYLKQYVYSKCKTIYTHIYSTYIYIYILNKYNKMFTIYV